MQGVHGKCLPSCACTPIAASQKEYSSPREWSGCRAAALVVMLLPDSPVTPCLRHLLHSRTVTPAASLLLDGPLSAVKLLVAAVQLQNCYRPCSCHQCRPGDARWVELPPLNVRRRWGGRAQQCKGWIQVVNGVDEVLQYTRISLSCPPPSVPTPPPPPAAGRIPQLTSRRTPTTPHFNDSDKQQDTYK